MADLLCVKITYTETFESPIHFRISYDPQDLQGSIIPYNTATTALKISKYEQELQQKNEEIQTLKLLLQSSDTKLTKSSDLIKELSITVEFKSKELKNLKTQLKRLTQDNQTLQNSMQSHQKLTEEISDLQKRLQSSEKIVNTHFELIEDLKAKLNEDFKFRTSELEKKLLDSQKNLNSKTSQVAKLTQMLKDREQRRTSAEVMLDEQEKKNNELIEKNVKNEKILLDLEKKVNELNKRISSLNGELKANDDVSLQRDVQLKKMLSKVKSQESELVKLIEEAKAKDKKIYELQKRGNNRRESSEKVGNYKQDRLKKAMETIAEKDDEISIMKDMIKSYQLKLKSPSKPNVLVKSTKLPPLKGSNSDRSLKPLDIKSQGSKTTMKLQKFSVSPSNTNFLYNQADQPTNNIFTNSIPSIAKQYSDLDKKASKHQLINIEANEIPQEPILKQATNSDEGRSVKKAAKVENNEYDIDGDGQKEDTKGSDLKIKHTTDEKIQLFDLQKGTPDFFKDSENEAQNEEIPLEVIAKEDPSKRDSLKPAQDSLISKDQDDDNGKIIHPTQPVEQENLLLNNRVLEDKNVNRFSSSNQPVERKKDSPTDNNYSISESNNLFGSDDDE